MKQNKTIFPKVIGHRGCVMPPPAPYQNSLKAFEKAITLDDGFEADVVKSADGTLYMMHPTRIQNAEIVSDLNHHLETMIGYETFFEDLSDKDIAELTLRDGSKIPTFAETLELVARHTNTKPHLTFNIELKGKKVAGTVCRMLAPYLKQEKIYPHNLILSSFDHDQLKVAQKELPFIPRGLLFAHKAHDGTAHFKALSEDYLKERSSLEATYGILPTGALTKDAIDALKAQGLDLIVWTESEKDDPELSSHLELALASGILKAVIADNPREVSCLISTLISSL